ncbi:hypothetical protein B0T24DRAFT_652728 [Lasiosphaeria ovina]|uniref:Fatty acid desaturase domain-containing protein n=1 Tax=Lasiosphaeria ovina TaxID=92902 RepID=A0AAE0MZJ8_9PEZI|nr:hypothetical protein B0T24DRAFT_652728 [Lasiosphaeria ovina]
MENIIFSSELTIPDVVVLRNLADDIQRHREANAPNSKPHHDGGYSSNTSADKKTDAVAGHGVSADRDAADIRKLTALNDAESSDFLPTAIYEHVVVPYVAWARGIVRHDTDVIMLTHLILYFTTSVPSALWLYYRFNYFRGILHFVIQFWYMGTYTLMMHQHIHMNGILAKKPFLRLADAYFPYITDPLMGHTWNSYYYHHVKHHHIEGNGPDDLSSTIRYQRDDILNFLHYVGRFFFLVWLDLPIYFFSKGRKLNAAKTAFWELSDYFFLYTLFCLNSRATTFVFLCPLLILRLGLMVGNWGQHAFVNADEPDSDFRSSITLIDVPTKDGLTVTGEVDLRILLATRKS